MVVPLLFLASPWELFAQFKSPTERLSELEAESKKTKEEIKKLKRELSELKATAGEQKGDEGKGFFSDGILTMGGVKLLLGGKAEILFVDSASERDPIVGSTNESDPRFVLSRLRLEPELQFTKELSLHSQIDFRPQEGRTVLRELTARHQVDPVWWFRSGARLGLDDRFIRPARRTKNYPLIGNAFWRDESIAFQWMLRFGDKDGKPLPKTGKGSAGAGEDSPGARVEDSDGEPVDLEAGSPQTGSKSLAARQGRTGREPFSVAESLGEIRTYFSVGNGYTLNNNETGFDRASFNDLVQDDRTVTQTNGIREFGLGLGYARNFAWLGEIDVLGFFYNDELNDASVDFLRQDLTLRDLVTGDPVAGYGNSDSRTSYRYGVGAEYFLPASYWLPAEWKPRGRDGLRLSGQWIKARDGEFRRDGWYVQGSYRYSFLQGLLYEKYFRSIEPVVRYGVLDTNLSASPLLPGTWDRRQLLVGAIVEVLRKANWEVDILTEYTFNTERTGGGGASGPKDVDNDELLVELLLRF